MSMAQWEEAPRPGPKSELRIVAVEDGVARERFDEIVQKSLVAGVAAVCAVSTPSSLAVAPSREFGMTLVGFVRDGRLNVYAGMRRLE